MYVNNKTVKPEGNFGDERHSNILKTIKVSQLDSRLANKTIIFCDSP